MTDGWSADLEGMYAHAAWGTATDDVWAVGPDGLAGHWDGSMWMVRRVGTSLDLYDVSGSGSDDVWAVGEAGTVVHWDGSSWSAVDSGSTAALEGVWSAGPTDAWIVAWDAEILRWDGVAGRGRPAAALAIRASGRRTCRRHTRSRAALGRSSWSRWIPVSLRHAERHLDRGSSDVRWWGGEHD